MKPLIRPTRDAEIERLFEVRATTRDNAISSARLAELGITPETLRQALQAGEMHSWVGLHEEQVVAFCNVHDQSGEVLVLAVQAGFEGRGLGRALLATAVRHLREVAGCSRIWLMAGADAGLRSHGFYRAQGWRPSGVCDGHGDEELLLSAP
ncbi:GNAT family N-acetyltransferase [Roseateles oligotrophus]|uniref:GNAT family N-acetyltransferase n=1 Tax=Roseateles oligotrophus TaxID=1769250 RepID=A0ABT2YJ46_9BURK|nr:GNAT family N-acetyltransferase [Roseateles oligotrophus]MCV2370065.1 GNAT family N-acetyltransferase [Roseateles oligotrophus]